MEIGRLILPFCEVIWGSLKLTPYKDGENVVTECGVSLQLGDSAPSANIKFRADPLGYEAYRKCVENGKSLVRIKFGYNNGPETDRFTFVFNGSSIVTGSNPTLEVELSSEAKYELTNVRGTSTLNSNDEEVTLKTIVERAKARLGVTVEIEYSKYFEQTKCRQVYLVGDNFKDFLNRLAQESGHTVKIEGVKKKIVLVPPTIQDLKENKIKKPKNKGTRKEEIKHGFLIGLGLVSDFSRRIAFNTPSDARSTKGAASESGGLKETDIKSPWKPKSKKEKEVLSDQLEKSKAVKGSDVKAITAENKTNKERERKLREEKAKVQETTAQTSVFMVPSITGITPRDVIFLPSLNGEYIEDWYVDGVEYNFSSEGVMLNLKMKRVSEEEGVILKDDLKEEFKRIAKGLTTPEKYDNYYWRF